MTKNDKEAKLIALAEKLHVRIITRKEPEDDTDRADKEILSRKS